MSCTTDQDQTQLIFAVGVIYPDDNDKRQRVIINIMETKES